MKFSGYQMHLPVKDIDGKIISERDERGQVIKEKDGDRPLTVKKVIREALTSNIQSMQEDEKKKFEDYQIATRVHYADPEGSIELTSEEITQIKKKVSNVWGIEIYGFIVDLLEGRNKDYKPSENNAQ